MISQTMQQAINAQIQAEMYSSNLYLSMAAYCESIAMRGAAHWMRIQASEETAHALKFFEYVIQRNGRSLVQSVGAPPQEWKALRDMFEQALAHEKQVTGLIYKLYEQALAEKDYATQNLLQWFISEQVEEEANTTEIVAKLQMIGESSNALFWVDKELGKRGASQS
ncbi:MAG: ferritin [Chloroflexi bacterium]|nr:ferritin [Chloroflexota bacterium]